MESLNSPHGGSTMGVNMENCPLRASVIGSYPFPGWLEFSSQHLEAFGSSDITEMQEDATIAAIHDQTSSGLDVITDGEQGRFDFNLSFYGYIQGIDLEAAPPRRFGPPAHDQRGKHPIIGELAAPNGLGCVEEFLRLKALAPENGPALKVSIPGPFTLSGRLAPNAQYTDRYAITEALLPLVRKEIEDLVAAGCTEICVDEPSMSCYAYKEDLKRFVDIFNRTIEPAIGRARLDMHMCFGNFKGRGVGKRMIRVMFPDFLELQVDEMHIEMTTTAFKDLDVIEQVSKKMDAAVGIIDVKSYYIETPEDVADRVRACLQYAPAEKLVFAPDCGLSQTARWAARQKLANMVAGIGIVKKELGLC
ncbi:MAG: 5-methyltetrahydropteroyltriglutamate--homocysteine methyltransferase [Verrucomicrobiales bacterium]|jgi:5-methyltetrahydropteroyltriglutamate--homocysteine methyltransferase